MNRSALLTASLLLAAAAGLAIAGPLDPPAGPVGPTMKTLTEVEPRTAVNATNTPGDNDATPSLFKITQPGSYYLTGNVTGVAGKNVIEIASSNVTLDLGGFLVSGGTNAVYLTSPGGAFYNVTIRNGQIAACSGMGVNANAANGVLVDHLTVQHCSAAGISVGPDARVTECTADYNAHGIYAAQPNSLVRACQASHNTLTGIYAADGTTIESCVASFNGARGIDAYNEVTVRSSHASHNGTQGIDGSANCTIEGCTVSQNQAEGIHGYTHLVVRNCSIDGNLGIGIHCFSIAGEITGNSLYGNAEGIRMTSNNGRIESNHLVANGTYGIRIFGTDNFVLRNILSGHPGGLGVSVAAGNEVGAFVVSPGENFATTNSVVNIAN